MSKRVVVGSSQSNENSSKLHAEDVLWKMANEKFIKDITSLIKGKQPVIHINSKECDRINSFFQYFSIYKGCKCEAWNSYDGLYSVSSDEEISDGDKHRSKIYSVLDHIINESRKYEKDKNITNELSNKGINNVIYLIYDSYYFFGKNDVNLESRIRAISDSSSIVSVIFISPCYKGGDCIDHLVQVLDFPCPSREEIKSTIYNIVDAVQENFTAIGRDLYAETTERESHIIDLVSGLTIDEAETALVKSLTTSKCWDHKIILEEKKQIIRKSGMLEYYDRDSNLNEVGGLKNLVGWITKRKMCFSEKAKQYGLKSPKGMLMMGFPGCGKSLACKCLSSYWEMPMIRLDFGRLFQGIVGSSERNIRDALSVAESLAPCVLWIDEIEKGISGLASSNQSDGGTASRVLGTFLTWMQEKTAPVFVVATANNVEAIPAEFLRAGRFDEIFFVGLPNLEEKIEIFNVLLKKNNIDVSKIDVDKVAEAADKFSGAEIEKAIDNAMITAFTEDCRKVRTSDILNEISKITPLHNARKEEFAELEEWVEEGRAVRASLPSKVSGSRAKVNKRDLSNI